MNYLISVNILLGLSYLLFILVSKKHAFPIIHRFLLLSIIVICPLMPLLPPLEVTQTPISGWTIDLTQSVETGINTFAKQTLTSSPELIIQNSSGSSSVDAAGER